ncbi:MAG: hypothetical protein QOF37_2284 [Thermoleophilaceae bacterium]|nr:hypothetical protein [Thermoleophilaceae bacterium]
MASIPIATRSQHRRLVDEAMDAYLDWRQECIAVSDAYRRWSAAGAADAALAFRGYLAALDREQLASEVYAGLIHVARDLVATDGEPATGHAAWWAS